jgi:hypothetical protein
LVEQKERSTPEERKNGYIFMANRNPQQKETEDEKKENVMNDGIPVPLRKKKNNIYKSGNLSGPPTTSAKSQGIHFRSPQIQNKKRD